MRYTYLSDGTKDSSLDASGNGVFYRGNFVYRKTGQSVTIDSIACPREELSRKPSKT